MKKRSVVLILVVIVIALSSCSQEKLGNFMGWMGNNVYGIKPDLRKPNAAISIIDKISGTDSIDLSLSDDLIKSVQKFKTSPSSVEAFREKMDDAVDVNSDAFLAVKNDMVDKADEIKDMGGEAGSIMIVLSDVIDSISDAVMENPTRRDVVTVVMVNKLVEDVYDSVKDGTFDVNVISDEALGVLDVLKMSTDFSSLNLIGDIDLHSLIDSLLSKSIDRANSKVAISLVGTTLGKVTGLITADGSFDEARYDRFLLESRAVMIAYEMVMTPYTFMTPENAIEQMGGSGHQFGMVTDDLTTFLSTGIVKLMEKLPANTWRNFLGVYLKGDNVVALSDLKNNASKLENPVTSLKFLQNDFFDYVAGEFGIESVDITGDGNPETPGQVMEEIVTEIHSNLGQAGGFSLPELMQFLLPMMPEVSEEDVSTDEGAMAEVMSILVTQLVEEFANIVEATGPEKARVELYLGAMAGILVDTQLMNSLLGL